MHPEILHICQQLGSLPGIDWKRLSRKWVLLTGCSGFLGYNFIHGLAWLNDTVLNQEKCHVVGVDNFVRGIPEWMHAFAARPDFNIVRDSVLTPTAEILRKTGSENMGVDFVIHAASIASPWCRDHRCFFCQCHVSRMARELFVKRSDNFRRYTLVSNYSRNSNS